MKICARCYLPKNDCEFYKTQLKKDGLYSVCKKCHGSSTKKWSKNNPEKKRRLGIYGMMLYTDKRKGFSTFSKEEFNKIIDIEICFYCGFNGPIGVDRIDNSKGHVVGNILPCCKYCNQARSNVFTVEQAMYIGKAIRTIRKRSDEILISSQKLRKIQQSFGY